MEEKLGLFKSASAYPNAVRRSNRRQTFEGDNLRGKKKAINQLKGV